MPASRIQPSTSSFASRCCGDRNTRVSPPSSLGQARERVAAIPHALRVEMGKDGGGRCGHRGTRAVTRKPRFYPPRRARRM